MNRRTPGWFLLFCLSSVCSLACLQGKETIGKHTALGTEFYFRTDQDRAIEEYYSLGAEIKLYIEPTDRWKFKLELDAGTDSVKAEEIWGKHRTPHTSLKLGTFENNLLLDDRISSRESLFAADNAVRTRMNLMGWYSPAATGAEFGWDQAGKLPGGYVHLFLNAAGSEFMAVTGLDFSCGENGPSAGVTGAYYPYIIHDLWVDDSASHTRDHYFLFNAFLADLADEKRLLYKMEVTAGTNLIDPIGYIHYPGDSGVSWFFGTDLSAGYTFQSEKDDFRWTPGLGASFLIHDLTAAETNSAEIRLGSRLSWHDRFYMHFDLGIRIETLYDTDEDYDPYLATELEALCGISVQVHI